MSEVTTVPNFDVEAVRSEFPIFGHLLPKGVRLAYLDSGASAQKPRCVIEKEREVYENYFANAYRGVYRFGARIDEEMEAARDRIRGFIGAESTDEVVFTAGTTMSLNIAAHCLAKAFIKPGDEILLNESEHHANLVPWQMVAEQHEARIRYIPLTADGQLDLSSLDELLTERTRVVSVAGMSNVLGTIHPIEELSRRAHAVGAYFVVDAAQTAPHAPIDVVAQGIDLMAFSGHKLFGPTAIGVLYGRRQLLEELPPFMGGGHMIATVTRDGFTCAQPPAKFEAGTLPIAEAISLGEAVRFVEELGLDAIHAYETDLLEYAWGRLHEIPGMKIHGPSLEHRGPILSFTMEGAHPEDLAQLLDRKGVFVRHGHHCTMPLHLLMGVPATVRVSLAMYNNRQDIDQLMDGLAFARQRLRLTD